MADNLLTQAEIDSLSRASERGGNVPARPPADRLSREQVDSLQARHERLARNLALALVPLVRGMVEIKVTGVAAQRYAELTDGLENPTCLHLVSAPPLEEKLLLEISPAIAFPLIDRMLGGGREKTVVARRPLTAIERRLMGRITGLFLEEFRLAWQKVIELAPVVERVESNSQLMQILAPHEQVVVVKFEIAIGDAHGNMRFCLPRPSVAALADAAVRSSAAGDGTGVPACRPAAGRRDEASPAGPAVKLTVHLAKTKIGAAELAGLGVGDILATDTSVTSPLMLSLDGVPRFLGRPGAFQGRKAIQIESTIDEIPPQQAPPGDQAQLDAS